MLSIYGINVENELINPCLKKERAKVIVLNLLLYLFFHYILKKERNKFMLLKKASENYYSYKSVTHGYSVLSFFLIILIIYVGTIMLFLLYLWERNIVAFK